MKELIRFVKDGTAYAMEFAKRLAAEHREKVVREEARYSLATLHQLAREHAALSVEVRALREAAEKRDDEIHGLESELARVIAEKTRLELAATRPDLRVLHAG